MRAARSPDRTQTTAEPLLIGTSQRRRYRSGEQIVVLEPAIGDSRKPPAGSGTSGSLT